MITINLLPEEFRIVVKEKSKIPVVPIALGLSTLFIGITLFLYVDYLMAKSKLASLEKEWQFVQPQSVRLTQLEKEVEGTLKPENTFLNQFVVSDKPLTTIFSWLSEELPETAWLREFELLRSDAGGKFILKGLTLPSKTTSSIEYIEKYLHELKKKMPDANLSLTTSRQTVKETELTQFTAIFDWTPASAQKA